MKDKNLCLGCGKAIWFRDGYWIDTLMSDPYSVAHLCDKPAQSGSNRHVPRLYHQTHTAGSCNAVT